MAQVVRIEDNQGREKLDVASYIFYLAGEEALKIEMFQQFCLQRGFH